MRALIAEDDDATGALVERGLRDLGHIVTRASRGDPAASIGLNAPSDVAILDRLLPGIDGVSVVAQWRASGVTTPVLMPTVPCVFISLVREVFGHCMTPSITACLVKKINDSRGAFRRPCV